MVTALNMYTLHRNFLHHSEGLGAIRPVHLDLEDAVGLAKFILVSPYHDSQ
jgi:hypothetical protein